MTTLNSYGWSNFHEENLAASDNNELSIGRVISIQGFKHILITREGEIGAELSGKLMYGASSEELPKVGDWVLFKQYESSGYLIEVLPRANALSRRSPGNPTDRQILATNIDVAFIVQGLDQNFNLMRLERYLVQLATCNIPPVIILNKSDLAPVRMEYIKEITRLNHHCPVHFCSTLTGEGMDTLQHDLLLPAKTYLLIGSSGVGKSSLLNFLLQNSSRPISSVSDQTGKGKHTTTTRDLFLLPNGSLLIDTPGMREFGVTTEDTSSQSAMFPAVQAFASGCRFANCQHTGEAGCNVLMALEKGDLDAALYENYLKLIKEQRRFSMTAEDKKRMNRNSGKISREASNHRKKNKF